MAQSRVGRRIKLGEVSKAILGIVAVAGVISVFAIAPGLPMAIGPFLKGKKYSVKQVADRNIASMIKKGLIKRTLSKDGVYALQLTKKGEWESGIRNLSRHREMKNEKWDGKWRLVVFDVPQSKNKVRDELRRAVSLYGFVKLQQSVWVYPYPCDDFVSLVRRYLGVSEDVLYLTSDYIENDRWLRYEFKLN